MKKLNTYINESLRLGKSRYKYQPKTKEELKKKIINYLYEVNKYAYLLWR